MCVIPYMSAENVRNVRMSGIWQRQQYDTRYTSCKAEWHIKCTIPTSQNEIHYPAVLIYSHTHNFILFPSVNSDYPAFIWFKVLYCFCAASAWIHQWLDNYRNLPETKVKLKWIIKKYNKTEEGNLFYK